MSPWVNSRKLILYDDDDRIINIIDIEKDEDGVYHLSGDEEDVREYDELLRDLGRFLASINKEFLRQLNYYFDNVL